MMQFIWCVAFGIVRYKYPYDIRTVNFAPSLALSGLALNHADAIFSNFWQKLRFSAFYCEQFQYFLQYLNLLIFGKSRLIAFIFRILF